MCNITSRVIKALELNHDVIGALIEFGKSPESISLRDDLGEDSMDRVENIMALEEEFEIDIADDETCGWETLQDVVDYVAVRVARVAA